MFQTKNIFTCLLIAISLAIGGISCSPQNNTTNAPEEEALVTVNGRTLYKKDLQNIIPSNIDPQDSAKAADAYIKLWINDELMYEKAQKNVADKERIEELVNNYKQSLTVFTYQEELLKERLSNQLSDNELKKFYDENSDKFKLKSNIIKGLFLKIPSNSTKVNDFRKWYKAGNSAALESIEKNHLNNAVIYDFFYDKWSDFGEVMSKIPYTITNSEDFLKTHKTLEVDDSTHVYLLHIKEYALTGSIAPFDYVKPQVTEVLTNQKRTDFLKKFKDDLYNEAAKKDKITYHYKKDSKN